MLQDRMVLLEGEQMKWHCNKYSLKIKQSNIKKLLQGTGCIGKVKIQQVEVWN